MIRSSIEKGFPAKKEGDHIIDRKNLQEACSSRPWSGLKDPRIVRVSRTFGGKDRHSKVRTIRGLRDRRVRLSVPTAIQLYDLQDRLGLNQPSKVVDWLLNAAQHAINELPPLQMPQENYVQFSQPMAVSREVTTPEAPVTSLLYANTERSSEAHSLALLSGKGDVKSKNEMDAMLPKSMHRISNDPISKCKGVGIERTDWMKRNEHENQGPVEVLTAQKWMHNSFPRPNHSFLTSSLNNVMPYTPYYHLELPPNASVSHLGGHGCSSQTEEFLNLQSSGSQLLLYPSGTTPTVPSYITPPVDFDPRQIMGFQMLGSSSQNLQPNSVAASLYSISSAARTFQLSVNPRQHHSHEIQSNALEKGINGPSTANTSSSFLNDSKATLGSNSFSFM